MTDLAPKPIQRPKLAFWLWERDIDLRPAGELFDCSPEQVRLICLPFDDEGRRVPGKALMERIVDRTHGEVGPPDFYPPRLLRPAPAAAAEVAP